MRLRNKRTVAVRTIADCPHDLRISSPKVSDWMDTVDPDRWKDRGDHHRADSGAMAPPLRFICGRFFGGSAHEMGCGQERSRIAPVDSWISHCRARQRHRGHSGPRTRQRVLIPHVQTSKPKLAKGTRVRLLKGHSLIISVISLRCPMVRGSRCCSRSWGHSGP
jgi:hypothetical protein